ncbi:hypothetical protein GCM10009836_58120 [Pseudonocardia ailaonensis]|uniref:Regulatory protein n=1 Tax=Pseudonocardia ailaonensis TaxID=367279 RepID=A0ABN2NKZ0_9PSEU
MMDPEGADTITVTIAATEPPQLQQGQPVTLIRLVAMPWSRNGRAGVAYRADEGRPVAATKSA